jgi:protein TonB
MDYARQQRDPARHAIGIGFVVLVHAAVIWALMSGFGKQMIDVIKKPLEATIVEEIKLPPPPPPPPPPKKIELPKPEPLVQPYVPPPDIPVAAPTTAPVISSVTATPPPEPVRIAPPPVVVAPPPPPKPAIVKNPTPIYREPIEYPRQAKKVGAEALVVARLNIDEKGNVTNVIIVSPPNRHFDAYVIETLKLFKFRPDGEKYIGEIEINFKMTE